MSGKHDSSEMRIRSADAADLVAWSLPEVSGSHLVALETKKQPKKKQALPVEGLPSAGLVLQPEKPKKDVVTVAEAESIREAAHQEGLLQGLVEGRERGYPEGLERGLEEGREKGNQEALAKRQAESEQIQMRLAQMLEALQNPIAEQEQQLEALLSGLVVKLASAVVDAELKTRPELIQTAIRDALQQLPQGGSALTIEVSPDDHPHIEPIASRFSIAGPDAGYSGR